MKSFCIFQHRLNLPSILSCVTLGITENKHISDSGKLFLQPKIFPEALEKDSDEKIARFWGEKQRKKDDKQYTHENTSPGIQLKAHIKDVRATSPLFTNSNGSLVGLLAFFFLASYISTTS